MAEKTHLLAIPLPLQGHMNPMLQLCKRLASNGVRITLITTISSAKISVHPKFSSIAIQHLDDDDDEAVDTESAGGIDAFLVRFNSSISKNLPKIISKNADSGCPVKAVLFDSQLPWILDIAHSQGVRGAAFFTQSVAVCAVYNHVHRGTLKIPLEKASAISLPSLPLLESADLPSFVSDPVTYPNLLDFLLAQNVNLEKADWVLFNSFDKLEDEVVRWFVENYPMIKTVGPSTPSVYVDKRLEDDEDYSLNLFKPSTEACIKWLDSKEASSVVYVSFGSVANLGNNQMEEMARGLLKSSCNFLWVVRSSEQNKIPNDVLSNDQERGLIVNWCPQLDVLAHEAVGCFMTHCGWNSTIEAVSLGVPMVAMPVWTDQTTNAKFIADVWQTGIRVRAGENGIVTGEEVERVVKEVMYGEKSSEFKNNALRLKELAKEAVSEGGSSDKNIMEFVAETRL